jgi:hypothetical protein
VQDQPVQVCHGARGDPFNSSFLTSRGRLSNRIRYYTQDIVVFRENLHQKLHRHAILPAASAEAMDVDEEDDGEHGAQLNISKHVRVMYYPRRTGSFVWRSLTVRLCCAGGEDDN